MGARFIAAGAWQRLVLASAALLEAEAEAELEAQESRELEEEATAEGEDSTAE